MYTPKEFKENDLSTLQRLIFENSFATLVSQGTSGLVASHVPLLLDPGRGEFGTLRGHVARANPQWREFTAAREVLAIFHGPHAYISPSWYAATPAVPTWNYVAIHAYGAPRLIEDRAALRDLLEAMVTLYEGGFERPWKFDLPEPFAEKMMAAIIGFEIPIARLEGKLKLNQNRSEADRAGVIAALRTAGDPRDLAVANLMIRCKKTGED